MEKIIYNFSLDTNRNGVQKVLQGFETGDSLSRALSISLTDGTDMYEIDENVQALMYVRQPSSTDPSIRTCRIVGNAIEYDVLATDVSEAGRVEMQIKMLSSDGVLISPRFAVEVWESLAEDSTAIASPEYTALEDALVRIEALYASTRVVSVRIMEDYTFEATFADGSVYTSDAIKNLSARIDAVDEDTKQEIARLEGEFETFKGEVHADVDAVEAKADKNAEDIATINTTLDGYDNEFTTRDLNAFNADINYATIEEVTTNTIKGDAPLNVEEGIITGEDVVAGGVSLQGVDAELTKAKADIKQSDYLIDDIYTKLNKKADNENALITDGLRVQGDLKVQIGSFNVGSNVGGSSTSQSVSTGNNAHAVGRYSRANGQNVSVSGQYSVGEGKDITVAGAGSIAIGTGLNVNSDNTIVTGRYNAPTASETFVIANGASDGLRHNAIEVREDGAFVDEDVYFKKDVVAPVDVGAGVASLSLPTLVGENYRFTRQAREDLARLTANVPHLTSTSPLTPTLASPIISLMAKGASRQDTTQKIPAIQGTFNGAVGQPINASVITSTTRCCTEVFALRKGDKLSITSGFLGYVTKANTEDGNIDSTSGWVSEYTAPSDGFYRVAIMKSGDGAITPSSFSLTAIVSPTPSNPIPIVDASGEVNAHTQNLFDVKANTSPRVTIIDASTFTADMTAASAPIDFDVDMKANNTYTISLKSSHSGFVIRLRNSVGAIDNAITVNSTTFKTTFTPSQDVSILRLYSSSALAVVTISEMMLEEGTSTSSYVPYQSNSITLPTLRSIGEVKDELIVNDDGSGELVQNVGVRTLTLTSSTKSSSGLWSCGIPITDIVKPSVSTIKANAMCDKYVVKSTEEAKTTANALAVHTNGTIYVNDSSAVGSLSVEVNIYYELATPIRTPLTASEVADILKLQTYKGTTIIDAEVETEVGFAVDIMKLVNTSEYIPLHGICVFKKDGSDARGSMINTGIKVTDSVDLTLESCITLKKAYGWIPLGYASFPYLSDNHRSTRMITNTAFSSVGVLFNNSATAGSNDWVQTGNVVSEYPVVYVASKSSLEKDFSTYNHSRTDGGTDSPNSELCYAVVDGVANTPCYIIFHYGRIYDKNGNIIREYVPMKRLSDGAIGFLETVSNVFHTNEASDPVPYKAIF